MTPRVTPEQVAVGDRVADKRWEAASRPGRGTVVAVFPDTARVRWDRSGKESLRALAMLRRLEAADDA